MDDLKEILAAATAFHDAYERLAPSFGYETRRDTREFDPNSPNGRLMMAVISEVHHPLAAEVLRLRAEVERLTEALLGVIPDSNNPKDLCWCPSYRDVRANGHSLKCVAARAALKEKPE